MKITINTADKDVILYILFSTIAYIGLLLGNYFITYMGLSLVMLLTSYLMAWYLLASIILNTITLTVNSNYIRTTLGTNTYIPINISTKIPIKTTIRIRSVSSPHLMVKPINVNLNTEDARLVLQPRWLGHAYIVGFIVEINDTLNLFMIKKFIRRIIRIDVEPGEEVHVEGTGALSDLITWGTSRSRTGDFMSIINYDFNEPASTIHWLTSARVNELMMIIRSEGGSCPQVIIEFSSKMLLPSDNLRPIDKTLIFLNKLLKNCGVIKSILINKYEINTKYLSRENLLDLEYELRHYIINKKGLPESEDEIMNKLSESDKMLIAYPQSAIDDSPSMEQLYNELIALSKGNILLIIRRELNISKLPNNVIVLGI